MKKNSFGKVCHLFQITTIKSGKEMKWQLATTKPILNFYQSHNSKNKLVMLDKSVGYRLIIGL